MKIGWKIRKLWHFEVSRIFKKHFLTSLIWICKWVRWWCQRLHNFPFILYTEMTKLSYFSYENVRLALILLWICLLTPIYLEGTYYHKFGQNINIFKMAYVQNIWQVVRWWHHQLTHLHNHIDWSRNVLWNFAKLQSVITSLFFNRFSSGFHCYVWKIYTLSSEIKLNLLWSSSLRTLNSLENWRRESCFTRTMLLHTSLWLQWLLCVTVALNW